jgi:hypothetical protein
MTTMWTFEVGTIISLYDCGIKTMFVFGYIIEDMQFCRGNIFLCNVKNKLCDEYYRLGYDAMWSDRNSQAF